MVVATTGLVESEPVQNVNRAPMGGVSLGRDLAQAQLAEPVSQAGGHRGPAETAPPKVSEADQEPDFAALRILTVEVDVAHQIVAGTHPEAEEPGRRLLNQVRVVAQVFVG
nr:hypothetical protein [Actinoplanes lichenicola]